MEYHPIANIMPMMTAEEATSLEASIKANGLIEPIKILSNGQIIDGRNRYEVCTKLGIEPDYNSVDIPATDYAALVSYVIALNKNRRHLTQWQTANISIDVEEIVQQLEREALRRKSKAHRAKLPYVETGKTTDIMGKVFGVSGRLISEARKLKKENKDLHEAAKRGESQAKIRKIVKKRKKEKQEKEKPRLIPEVIKKPVIHCASADSMPIDDNVIDVIITSPPYNLGADSWPMGGEGRERRDDGIGYSDNMDLDDYDSWQLRCFIEFYRVAKPGASFFYNHKVRTKNGRLIHPVSWILLPSNPWVLRQEVIWDRTSTHNHSASLFWPEDERIYWMTKGDPTLPDRPIGLSTVWREHGPTPNTWHPAPFTTKLPDMLLSAIGSDGITVLDPFMGSGSTLLSALSFGYDAIGVDVNQEYINKAREASGWTKTQGD